MNDSPAMKASQELTKLINDAMCNSYDITEEAIAAIIEKHQQPSVSALEAENERLRDRIQKLIDNYKKEEMGRSFASGSYIFRQCHDDLEDILNREQEKA